MKEVDSPISPKHIYTILNTDRRGIYTAVLKAFGVPKVDVQNSFNESAENSSIEYSSECDKKAFRLIISEKNWNAVQPVVKEYSNRRYLKLKPGEWSNVFAAKIWQQTKIPCAFTFKNATVFSSPQAKCYASFHAVCKECKAILRGKMLKKPNDAQDAIFECSLSGFNNQINHVKKRQLKGSLRQNIAGHLIDTKKHAATWRIEESKRLMEFGDKNPPILYSPRVLRKAKQNELDNRLGINNCDATKNLQMFKYSTQSGSIHAIGLDPFYAMYWSKEQLTMYKIINRDRSAYFTMDATGSVAKELSLPNGTKSAHLFLYQCMIVPKDKPGVPVFQMISAKQDAALLTYFLLEIRRAGATLPSIVVIDHSRAMLAALSRAFADCADLKHYLQCCYDIVVKKKPTFLPAVYIRLDVSHIIKIISNWECLRHSPSKVRQFYLRCVSQAYKMQNFKELCNLLTAMLVVALSEDVGYTDENNPVLAETCLQSVNDCIKGVHVDDQNEKCHTLQDDFDFDDTSLSWREWSNELYIKANHLASQSRNGNVVNAFYNPAAAKKVKSLLQNLPLWTGIMRPHFKIGNETATSYSVESPFSKYKNSIFKGSLPMRVDKFIVSHLDYLDSKLRLAYAANIPTVEQKFQMSPEQKQTGLNDNFTDTSFFVSTPISRCDNGGDHSCTNASTDKISLEITNVSIVPNSP